MLKLFSTALLLCLFSHIILAQSDAYDSSSDAPYSAELEENILDRRVELPVSALYRQDTSAIAVAWVAPFQDGFRALRRDGKMGLLNADLTVRVPFLYVDIQRIVTGLDQRTDYVLIGRRSSYGRYGVIDEAGVPKSEFALSFNDRLRIFGEFIIDSPQPNQYFLRHRDGRPASDGPFAAVWTHPVLISKGHRVVNVRQPGSQQLALFNLDNGKEVTPYSYDRISRVEPIVGRGNYIPLLEGYTGAGIDLIRPSGKILSPLKFSGVEGYNNWKQLRTYFGLPDDPTAEAIAWTKNMDVYVVYQDDRVVFLGRFEGL